MTPDDWGFFTALASLVVLSGSVSGSETAFFNLEPGEVDTFRSGRSPVQRLAANLIDQASDLLLTILVLNNLINLAYFALVSAWAAQQERTDAAMAIATGGLLGLIIFGEILPKVIASARSADIATIAALPMRFAMAVCAPMTWVVSKVLGNLLTKARQPQDTVTADELKLVIEQTGAHGVVSPLAQDRLMEVIDLSETRVLSVMTHRVDCCTIDQGTKRPKAIDALRDKPSPFMLVLDDDDECVGLLTAQDLLKGGRPSKRMRKPLFVPGNANLAQALNSFKGSRRTAAVVVDEYGGTLGLLTLAHLGNELLGPGASVDLPQLPNPERTDATHWALHGSLPLDGWQAIIREEDSAGCTTIGGFVTKMLGDVPQHGDRLLYGNLLFQVDELDGRRVGRITVEQLPEAEARRMSNRKADR